MVFILRRKGLIPAAVPVPVRRGALIAPGGNGFFTGAKRGNIKLYIAVASGLSMQQGGLFCACN